MDPHQDDMNSYQRDRVELRKTFLRGNKRRTMEHPVTHISTVGTYLKRGFHSERGGVILITEHNGRINYGLGTDHRTNELTDFGGKIHPFENSIAGALREFTEETLGIFVEPSIDDIQDCIVIHNEYMLIIFILVEMNPLDICDAFGEALMTLGGENSEISCIMFFTEEQFIRMLHHSRNVYSKLAWFLCDAKNFYLNL